MVVGGGGWFDLAWREALRGAASGFVELLGSLVLPRGSTATQAQSCPACVCQCGRFELTIELSLVVSVSFVLAFIAGTAWGRCCGVKTVVRSKKARDDRVLLNADELR